MNGYQAGGKINNDTGVGDAHDYPYNYIYFCKLSEAIKDQKQSFNLHPVFYDKFNKLIARLQLYVANKYDCTK